MLRELKPLPMKITLKLCVFATRRGQERVYGHIGRKGFHRAVAKLGLFPLTGNHSMLAIPIVSQEMTVQELLIKYDE